MLFGTFIHILTSLIRDFCTSDRNFASTFFQIPPRDGHPWSWLVVGHCDYNPHNRLSLSRYMPCPAYQIKTAFKKRGFLCGYKPLLTARVSRRCFHFVQAIAFDSRQPSKGFIFYYFFLFAFSCLYACCSASENGFAYSFTLILSIAISCISCSRIYFATVASFNPTVLT